MRSPGACDLPIPCWRAADGTAVNSPLPSLIACDVPPATERMPFRTWHHSGRGTCHRLGRRVHARTAARAEVGSTTTRTSHRTGRRRGRDRAPGKRAARDDLVLELGVVEHERCLDTTVIEGLLEAVERHATPDKRLQRFRPAFARAVE